MVWAPVPGRSSGKGAPAHGDIRSFFPKHDARTGWSQSLMRMFSETAPPFIVNDILVGGQDGNHLLLVMKHRGNHMKFSTTHFMRLIVYSQLTD